MTTGRRIVLTPTGAIRVDGFEVPDPGPDQVLVRTTLTQVSAGTEINAVRVRRAHGADAAAFEDLPLGYTSVGVVEAVGRGVRDLAPGDRVLGEGPHASHWLVDHGPGVVRGGHELLVLPPDVDDVAAAFAILGDVAMHAVRHARIALGESAAVHGLGVIGLIALRLARLTGAYPVIGVDVDAERMRVARLFGASHTVDANEDVPAAIRAATPVPPRFGGQASVGLEPVNGADVQIHATSRIDVLPVMLASAADRGRIVIAGATAAWPDRGPTVPVGLDELLRREITVCGSYQTGMEGSHPYWPWSRPRQHQLVLDLVRRGELDVRPLTTHVVPCTEAAHMYDLMAAGTAGWLSVSFDWSD